MEGLRQLAQVGAASEHSALLFVNIVGGFCQTNLESDSTTSLQCTIRKFPKPPVPAKTNILYTYSRGLFVDMVYCITTTLMEQVLIFKIFRR